MAMGTGVELITIGDELLLGFTIDTNGAFLARELAAVGVSIVRRTSVGDDATDIAGAVREALERTGAAITTARRRPSSPKVSWTNSSTSRPRSPIMRMMSRSEMMPTMCRPSSDTITAPMLWRLRTSTRCAMFELLLIVATNGPLWAMMFAIFTTTPSTDNRMFRQPGSLHKTPRCSDPLLPAPGWSGRPPPVR